VAASALRRLIEPKEIAAMAVYLASETGRSISGQSISRCLLKLQCSPQRCTCSKLEGSNNLLARSMITSGDPRPKVRKRVER